MKKIIMLLLFINFIFANANSQSTSCQSLFAGAESIFNSLSQDFIEFRGDASKVFVDYIIPGKPDWESKLNGLIDDATAMQIKLYKSYGIIAGQSNGHIGAIDLIVPVAQWKGTCFTERTFNVLRSPYDKVVITIKKTDGKRGLDMAACAKYSNGSIYDHEDRSIDHGNETAGTTRTITFEKEMMDKNISIHLVATGALPTDKCEYTMKIEGFFDENEMVAINDANTKPNKKGGKKGNQKTTQPANTGHATSTMSASQSPAVKSQATTISPQTPVANVQSPKDVSSGQATGKGKKKQKNSNVVVESQKPLLDSTLVAPPARGQGKKKRGKNS